MGLPHEECQCLIYQRQEFTAVDSNITRHLPDELESDDWKALVLHYVGLDNIAHFGGSNG